MFNSESSPVTAVHAEPIEAEQDRKAAKRRAEALLHLAEVESCLARTHYALATKAENHAAALRKKAQSAELFTEEDVTTGQGGSEPVRGGSMSGDSGCSPRTRKSGSCFEPGTEPNAKRACVMVEVVDLTIDSDEETMDSNEETMHSDEETMHSTPPPDAEPSQAQGSPELSRPLAVLSEDQTPFSAVTHTPAPVVAQEPTAEAQPVQPVQPAAESLQPSDTVKLSAPLKPIDDGRCKTAVQSPGKSETIAHNGSLKTKNGDHNHDGEDMGRLRKAASTGAIGGSWPKASWDSIIGLGRAKDALKNVAIMHRSALQTPSRSLKPAASILLYGPPGTGKSSLAKAAATEMKSRFFCISSRILIKECMEESAWLIKQIYKAAHKAKSSSVIFIDDVDALGRPSDASCRDAHRRIVSELVTQVHIAGKDQTGVLTIGATAAPWNLDAAVRQCFAQRRYIPLPDLTSRMLIFEISTSKASVPFRTADYELLAKMTQGYSGHDLVKITNNALKQHVARVREATHFKDISPAGSALRKMRPCSPRAEGAIESSWNDLLQHIEGAVIDFPPYDLGDFIRSVSMMQPTVKRGDIMGHAKFTQDFGSEFA